MNFFESIESGNKDEITKHFNGKDDNQIKQMVNARNENFVIPLNTIIFRKIKKY